MDTVTRDELVTRIRDRANMPYGGFVSDTELETEVDQAVKELWDKLIIARGQDYLVNYGSITTVNNDPNYALEDDFYQMLAVYVSYNGEEYPLGKFTWQDEWKYLGNRAKGILPPQWKWRTNAYLNTNTPQDWLEIRPIPTGAYSITYTYIPTVWHYTSGGAESTTTYNGINGYEDYVVARVVRYCLAKEESDTSFWDQELMRIEARIQTMAGLRDHGEPERIRDAYAGTVDDPYAEVRWRR